MGAPRVRRKKRPVRLSVTGIEDLPITRLQGNIQWSCRVWMKMLGQADESMLSEIEWPKKSGLYYFVCVTSGLLFDKGDGHCLQSSSVRMMLETVEPASMNQAQLLAWVKRRQSSGVEFGRYGSYGSEDNDGEE